MVQKMRDDKEEDDATITVGPLKGALWMIYFYCIIAGLLDTHHLTERRSLAASIIASHLVPLSISSHVWESRHLEIFLLSTGSSPVHALSFHTKKLFFSKWNYALTLTPRENFSVITLKVHIYDNP
jgi:hypothetical protein